ncbi:MAG: patched family protein [Deltaproteobacteria bacterium]|nr:MAG: patched family protein [Deltaproteobacteria bacterium]TDJ10017.1 MAG: patched family protein [Deltaproteobacteria bacterium]
MSETQRPPGIRDRIEAGFERWGHFVSRRAWTTLALAAFVTLALASQLPKLELETSTEGFLHADDPVRVAYNAFRHQFGHDGILLIGVRTRDVFERRFLEKLRAFHRELEDQVPQVAEITSLINVRATRGEDHELIVEELMEKWPEDASALAALRKRALANPLYRNLVISKDARFTIVSIETDLYSSLGEDENALAGFEAEGKPGAAPPPFLTGKENAAVVAAVYEVMERHRGPDFELYAAGQPILLQELQSSMRRDMTRFVLLSLVVIAGLLWILFRRFAGVVLPLVMVLVSLACTLGLMGLTGVPIGLPTQILPSFLLAIGVGAAVHLLVIFFQALDAGREREDAIAHALGHSGLAISMTSLTTAGGLASFTSAEVAPVVDFGIFAPIGALFILGFSIVLLPALLALIPLSRASARASAAGPPVLDRILTRCGDIASQHPWTVVVIWSALIFGAMLGTPRLTLSHDPLAWFPPEQRFRLATTTIDHEFQGSMSLEVLIETGAENGLYAPELLNRIDELRLYAEAYDHDGLTVGKTISLVDVLKEIHQALNENRSDYYAIPQDRELVAQELLLFENSGSDDLEDLVDSQFNTARFTLRIPWTDAVRYPPFIAKLKQRAGEIMGEGVELQFTGIMRVMSRTINALLVSMIRSYAIALIVITPLMILLIGSLRGGLLSMIPNLAPVVITLGVMGWFGIPLDAFNLLLGCIAIGLAVDDTIHFMHNFQRYYNASGDAPWAVHETLRTTGRALLFTTLVLAAGFFIYMFSSMNNLSDFGFLTGFCLLVAFLADILLAPALMVLVRRRSPRLEAAPLATQGASR